MAIGAIKFIGLAIGAMAVGVLSASIAFGRMEFGAARSIGHDQKNWMAKAEDEIPRYMRHIMWR